MKFLHFLLLVSLGSCTTLVSDYNLEKKPHQILFHHYSGSSNVSPNSSFKLLKRIIEFDFQTVQEDSLILVKINCTSGFDEGQITGKLFVVFENDEVEEINLEEITVREYVEQLNYNTTTPVIDTKVINDPGGVDIVVQPDGTHKQVHRAPSSKTVTVTENVTQTNTHLKSQIFNSGQTYFDERLSEKIKELGIRNFEIEMKNARLKVQLDPIQKQQLMRFL